jgi:lipoate-protein ligase A
VLKTAQNTYKTQKLIKILLKYNDQEDSKKIINSIKITGDFFLYPEESLEDLEAQLKGTLLDRYKLKEKIDKCLENSEAFGFDTESMVAAILGCVDGQLN